MEFKYKTKFSSNATFDFGKWKEAKAKKQVFASLDNLRSLLPADEEINDNPDLLFTSFNAAVVNLINANDHGITTETALAISKYFVHKHMNIEHSRWDVVGHIITQGFSSFGDNKILKEKDLAGTNEPFNICLGAIVYKIVREYMAEIIKESGDSKSEYHEYISTSWEVGFNEYDIVLGSKKISDATIISDPEEVAKYSQYLRMEGGEGFTPDGTPVYCLIKGDARPLGCAFTSSPAAAVKGVFVPKTDSNDDEEEDEEEDEGAKASDASTKLETPIGDIIEKAIEKEFEKRSAAASEEENSKKSIDNTKNNSHNNKNTVIKYMKLKSTEEITPEYLQTAEASVEVRRFIADELDKTSQEFISKLDAANKEKDQVQANLDKQVKELTDLQNEFEVLKKQVEAKAKQEAFDARMDEITSKYELDDKQTKSIASQIKELDETAFATWKSDIFEPFAKVKTVVVASTEVAPEKEKETEKAPDPAEVVKTASASTATPPNAIAPEKNELDALVESLKRGISVG